MPGKPSFFDHLRNLPKDLLREITGEAAPFKKEAPKAKPPDVAAAAAASERAQRMDTMRRDDRARTEQGIGAVHSRIDDIFRRREGGDAAPDETTFFEIKPPTSPRAEMRPPPLPAPREQTQQQRDWDEFMAQEPVGSVHRPRVRDTGPEPYRAPSLERQKLADRLEMLQQSAKASRNEEDRKRAVAEYLRVKDQLRDAA